jgi:hypothetical protein
VEPARYTTATRDREGRPTQTLTANACQLKLAPTMTPTPDDIPDLKTMMEELSLSNDETNHPIHRLAPEVLAEVFIHTRDLQLRSSGDSNVEYLLLVCRDWRQIALDCAPLWGVIANVSREPMLRSVLRSRNGLLSITYEVGQGRLTRGKIRRAYKSLANVIVAHYSRLRSLNLQFITAQHKSDVDARILDSLNRTFPCLENLQLSDCYKEYGHFLPEVVISDCPTLRSIQLWDVDLQISTEGRLHSVETIQIRCHKTGDQSLLNFLGVLKFTPALKRLYIDAYLSFSQPLTLVTFSAVDKVSLPCLQELCIRARATWEGGRTLELMTKLMELPEACKVSISG